MSNIDKLLKSGLFSEIKEEEYEKAYSGLRVSSVSYNKGEVIFLEGDRIDSLCIIGRGAVMSEKVYPDGGIFIGEMFETGTIFASEVVTSRTRLAAVSYVAAENAEVLYIPYEMILESAYAMEFSRALSFMLSDYAIRQAHKIEILAERSIRGRILTYLGILKRKAGQNTVTVSMSREELARYLCVNRSALSSELSKMRKEGLVDWKGKRYTIY